jgi:hypothetical protein
VPERTLAGASNAQAPSLTALRRFRLLCFHAGRLLVLSTAEVSHRPSLFFGPKDTSKDKMLVRACVRNPNRRMARRLARAQARLCSQALRKEVETAFEALELALHSAASLAPGLPSMVRCMLHAAGSMSHVVCCMLHVPCLHVTRTMLHVAPGLPGLGMHGASELACRTRLRALHRDAHCGLHRLWSATAGCQKANATGRAQRSLAALFCCVVCRMSRAILHGTCRMLCARARGQMPFVFTHDVLHTAARQHANLMRSKRRAIVVGGGELKRRQCVLTLGSLPATSAPGLGSPLPHLHREWARPCHICTGTGLAP